MGAIPLEESLNRILEAWKTCGRKKKEEYVPLWEGAGRILAGDLYSPIDQPPFHRSPIDGYAVRAGDTKGASKETPVSLRVIDQVMAGECSEKEITAGTAVRIMTGAPIPKGADSTIRQEDTNCGEDTVELYKNLKPHENICDRGEDYKKGDCLLKKGDKLDWISIGIAAGMGYETIPVYQKPRIALYTTGDEVILPGNTLGPGKIYNSNLYMAGCRLMELGNRPYDIGTAEDSPLEMKNKLKEACETADLVITTGGVSVGKKDIMHDALSLLGAKRLFWKINSKPGSPVIGSVYENTIIISLSGNPFGAAANLELLVRPVIAEMSGDKSLRPQAVTAVMADDFKKASTGRRFIRAILNQGQVTLPRGLHSSGVLGSMKGCNCFIDIEAGNQGLKKGDLVHVLLL